ncbi:hypothetical protein HDV02_004598 [Globomyces sp. JEL0801]|nr:hypothetical protein HDV02_004598 [Globomyces sp. JEL0801]
MGDKLYCCCFRRRFHCIAFATILVVSLGLLIYFIFPASPLVNIGETYVPPNSGGLMVNGAPLSLTSAFSILATGGNMNISFPTATDISIYSYSYVNFGIQQLDVTVQVKDDNGNIMPKFAGRGNLTNIKIVPRGSSNPLMMTLETNVLTIASDPTIKVLTSACRAGTDKKLSTRMTVTVDIAALSWLGIKPTFSFDPPQQCHDISQLQNLFSLPKI